MRSSVLFGLSFGSLVFVRAALDGGSAGVLVTVLMFCFFAGVSAAAHAVAAAALKRGPLLTAGITALFLLSLLALPFLLGAPLSGPMAARIAMRLFFAWLYVNVVYAGLSRRSVRREGHRKLPS